METHSSSSSSASHSSPKHEEGGWLRRVLTSHVLDIIVVVLVVFDVSLVTVETLIDFHLVCIDGIIVPMAPHQVVDLVGLGKVPASLVVHATRLTGLQDGSWGSSREMPASPRRLPVPVPGRVDELAPAPVASQGIANDDTATMSGQTRGAVVGGFGDVQAPQASRVSFVETTKRAAPESAYASALVCDARKGTTAYRISRRCHTLSLYILAFFMLELTLKMCVTPTEFFHSFLHKLDLFVVSVSIFMDTFLYNHFGDIFTVLVLIRLWRVVRIFHGIIELFDNELEARHHIEKHAQEQARRELALQGKLPGPSGGSS